MAPRLFLFVYIVSVSAQLIRNQQENPGFTDCLHTQRYPADSIKCGTASGVSVSNTRGKTAQVFNEGNRRNQMNNESNRQRDVVNSNSNQSRVQTSGGSEIKGIKANTFHDGNRRDQTFSGSVRQRDTANFKEHQNGNQTPKAFTNLNPGEHGKNVKYIEVLNSTGQPDKIVFYDDVNYDRVPFTNRRRPEENSTNNNGPRRNSGATPDTYRPNNDSMRNTGRRRDPTATPGVTELPIQPDTGTQRISNGKPSTDRIKNISDFNTTGVISKYNGVEETTTEGFDLEDRVAFDGDKCAKGFVKVQGKCVQEQK